MEGNSLEISPNQKPGRKRLVQSSADWTIGSKTTAGSSKPLLHTRPILFNANSVRAILDNRKTMTRRLFSALEIRRLNAAIKLGEISDFFTSGVLGPHDASYLADFSRWKAGDHLWVKETFW